MEKEFDEIKKAVLGGKKKMDFDEIMREFFIKHKNFNEKNWTEFWEIYKKTPIVEDIELIVNICKQRTTQKLLSKIDEAIKYYIIQNALNESTFRNERIKGLEIAEEIIKKNLLMEK